MVSGKKKKKKKNIYIYICFADSTIVIFAAIPGDLPGLNGKLYLGFWILFTPFKPGVV